MLYIILGVLLGLCGLALWWHDKHRTRPNRVSQTPPSESLTVGGVPVRPVPLPEDEEETSTAPPVQATEVGVVQGEEEIEDATELRLSAAEIQSAQELHPEADTSERGLSVFAKRVRQKANFAALGAFTSANRRERRAWAAQHGFEYTKSDAYLADEWTHQSVARNGSAQDVISGIAHGYEVHIADIANLTVLALRRAAASDVVVELRSHETLTPAEENSDEAEELAKVGNYAHYAVYSDEPAAVQRTIDERFTQAIATFPATALRIWAENDWLLVEWSKENTTTDWTAALSAAAQLADVLRVLPPSHAHQAHQPYAQGGLDPSRPLPVYFEEPEIEAASRGTELPQFHRETPRINLPSRAKAVVRGEVELRSLGSDEVDAIGDGSAPDIAEFQGTRAFRQNVRGSSIFADMTAEFGKNPLGEQWDDSWEEPSETATAEDTGVSDAEHSQKEQP